MKNDLAFNVSLGKTFHLADKCEGCRDCDCRSSRYFSLEVRGHANEKVEYKEGYTCAVLREFVGNLTGVVVDLNEDLSWVAKKLGVMENEALNFMMCNYLNQTRHVVIADGYFNVSCAEDFSSMITNLRTIINRGVCTSPDVVIYIALSESELKYVKKLVEDDSTFEILDTDTHRALVYLP